MDAIKGHTLTVRAAPDRVAIERGSQPLSRRALSRRTGFHFGGERSQGLDCLDGTPLLDLKPDRSLFTPIAPPQPGDDATDIRHLDRLRKTSAPGVPSIGDQAISNRIHLEAVVRRYT
jgi:hypothetical protein